MKKHTKVEKIERDFKNYNRKYMQHKIETKINGPLTNYNITYNVITIY